MKHSVIHIFTVTGMHRSDTHCITVVLQMRRLRIVRHIPVKSQTRHIAGIQEAGCTQVRQLVLMTGSLTRCLLRGQGHTLQQSWMTTIIGQLAWLGSTQLHLLMNRHAWAHMNIQEHHMPMLCLMTTWIGYLGRTHNQGRIGMTTVQER